MNQLMGDGVLQVEPTDRCNLTCSMCLPHKEGKGRVHGCTEGLLSPELWGRIADGLVADDCSFDHIIFQWMGEPTLHPQLEDLVAIAAEKLVERVGYLRIDTNGILLTRQRVKKLLESMSGKDVPLLVVFTLDAATAGTYEKVKGRPHFAQVVRNVRRFIGIRAQLGERCRVNVQVQMVVQPGNADEVGAFVAYWRDLFRCYGGPAWHDEIMLKRLSVGGGSEGQAAADDLYCRSVNDAGWTGKAGPIGGANLVLWEQRPWQVDDGHTGARGPCPGLWLTPVIRHDGKLHVCCADLHGEMVLGQLGVRGFRELWDGSMARSLRAAHLEGRFEGVCAGCGGINWYAMPSGVSLPGPT